MNEQDPVFIRAEGETPEAVFAKFFKALLNHKI